MNIENISNAFLKIRTTNHTIITDPWLSQGIFDNSLGTISPVYESQRALRRHSLFHTTHSRRPLRSQTFREFYQKP